MMTFSVTYTTIAVIAVIAITLVLVVLVAAGSKRRKAADDQHPGVSDGTVINGAPVVQGQPAPPTVTDPPVFGAADTVAPGVGSAMEAVPADVIEAIRAGQKVEAIKRLRAHTGGGLKETRNAVENIARRLGLG